MKKFVALILCAVLCLVTASTVVALDPPENFYAYSVVDENAPVDTQVIVRYTDDQAGRSTLSARSDDILSAQKVTDTMDVIQCETEAEAKALVAELSQRDDVAAVNQNYTMEAFAVPNDTYYDAQYYYDMVGAADHWNTSPASTAVTVAVIDTGLYTKHEDLSGRYATGYDVLNGRTSMTDTHYHGTAVAGIIAAKANNKKGIAGISGTRNIKIIPYRVSASERMIGSHIEAAIERATKKNVDVINMSFGGTVNAPSIKNLLKKASAKGITLVAAAGNGYTTNGYNFNYTVKMYPASYDNVISVASVGQDETHSYFSQRNSAVDLCAPGEYIATTVPKTVNESGYTASLLTTGTSFSAPMVAAAAAILKTYNRQITPAQIQKLLENTATDLGKKGKDPYYGSGMIDIEKAIQKMNPASVSMSAQSVPVGYSGVLAVKKSPSYATMIGAKFKSSNEKIATVTNSGKITAKKPGKVTITLTTKNGKTAKATVTIVENVTLRVGYKKTILNGKKTSMSDGKPQVVKTRTMIPMRYVFEVMGCKVKFTAANKPIVVSYKDKTVSCSIGSKKMTVKSKGKTKVYTLDSPPLIISGRTYLPIRAVSESLGFGIYYDSATKLIAVTNPKKNSAFAKQYLLPPAKKYIR